MLERPGRAAPRRPVLPAGRLLHRPVAAGRARRHHPCACRPCAPRPRPLPRARRRPKACCAPGSARRSRCRRWPTARRSSTTACAVSLHPGRPCARLGPGAARARRPGLGRLGRLLRRRRAPTARGQRHLRALRAGALRLLHHRIDLRPADLPLAAAGRAVRRDRRLVARATPRPAAPACCSATASARRSASCTASTRSIGPIVVHGAVEPLNRAYRAAGVDLPETPAGHRGRATRPLFRRALIVAPPSVQGSAWTRRFGELRRCLRQRLDAAARRAPAARRRPRLRPQRPRRLARPAARHRRHRRRAGDRHPRLRGGDGALAERAGPGGERVRDRVRRQRRRGAPSAPSAAAKARRAP